MPFFPPVTETYFVVILSELSIRNETIPTGLGTAKIGKVIKMHRLPCEELFSMFLKVGFSDLQGSLEGVPEESPLIY